MLNSFLLSTTCYLAALHAKLAANIVSWICEPICTIPTVENYFSSFLLMQGWVKAIVAEILWSWTELKLLSVPQKKEELKLIVVSQKSREWKYLFLR